MEFCPQNQDRDGLLGPKSIMIHGSIWVGLYVRVPLSSLFFYKGAVPYLGPKRGP